MRYCLIIMRSIKNKFDKIREGIFALIEENKKLKLYIADIEQDIENKKNELDKCIKENKNISEENRLIKLSSTPGKNTGGLKKELADILREIDESLELIRKK